MRQINAALGQTIVTGDKGRRVLTPGVEQNVKLVMMLEQSWILNNAFDSMQKQAKDVRLQSQFQGHYYKSCELIGLKQICKNKLSATGYPWK